MRKKPTPQESILWHYLRQKQLGVKFRRQFPVLNQYIVDFVCLEKKIIIELDGSQHNKENTDLQRNFFLQEHGFTIIRFWNNQIEQELETCLQEIYRIVQSR